MEYLEAAHTKIEECANACRCWCVPYNGENPAPTSLMALEESGADDSGTIADSDATPIVTPAVTPSAEPHGGSVFLDAHRHSDVVPSAGQNGDTIKIESHGHAQAAESASKEKDVASDKTENHDDVSKLPVIAEGSKLQTSQKDSYAESVTSEADSALSGSSSNTDNVQNGSENPASRSDSPLNDNFDTMDFNAFLLSLKRVKTPVEFCDNIEDSIHEIDELINDLKHIDTRSGKSQVKSPKTPEELPKFTDSATVDNSVDVVKPSASKTSPSRPRTSSDGSTSSSNQSKPAESTNRLSDISLEDKLSEFESESSVKKTLDTMPHHSSSVSDITERPRTTSESSSAFVPLKSSIAPAFAPTKYPIGSPNIG